MSRAATKQIEPWALEDVVRFRHLRDITRDEERHRRHELLTAFVSFERRLDRARFTDPKAQDWARELWSDVRGWLKLHPMDDFSYRRIKSIYG